MAGKKAMKALRRNRKKKIGKAIIVMFIALVLIGTAIGIGGLVTIHHTNSMHIVTNLE